ncbi:MAG: hypothetical protein ACXWVO_01930 [Caulobacteraceae bacterium]
MLGGALLAGAATAANSQTTLSTPPAAPPKQTTLERVAIAAQQNRYPLNFDGRTFSGSGWDWISAEGRKAQHFLFGEDHGYSEVAKLATALAVDLAPAGYSEIAIEISPPLSAEIDAAVASGGVAGLKSFFEQKNTGVAFYTMREEAEFLAAARKAYPAKGQVIHGLDYDVFADRRLIERLKAKRKPVSAQAALDALEKASLASWAEFRATKNPEKIYSFAGDPDLVRAVRAGWPKPDRETDVILRTLEETFEINRHWFRREGYLSNLRRSRLMRANLVDFWTSERAPGGTTPKTFFKFGASHMMRGLSTTDVFDIGTMASEAAALEGHTTFQLMVVGGKGAVQSVFNPVDLVYMPTPVDTEDTYFLPDLVAQALPTGSTVFDTRPLRPILSGARVNDVSTALARVVHAFDAVIIMPNATPSATLHQIHA